MNTQRWSPSLSFLSSGYAEVSPNFHVQWKFRRLGNFVSCRMQSKGFESEGGSESMCLKKALICSLAEAWERLWLNFTNAESSNGFAAGPTDVFAIERARAELIERAMMLEAWRSMCGWSSFAGQSFLDHLAITAAHHRGWRVRSFQIRTKDEHTTLAILGTHARHGAVFDCVYAGQGKLHKPAVRRLYASLKRMLFFAEREPQMADFHLPENASPIDHRNFYAKPSRLEAFAFLDDPKASGGYVTLPPVDKITVNLLCPAGTMPAVAMAQHPQMPPLAWGSQAILGKNQWPHPLA